MTNKTQQDSIKEFKKLLTTSKRAAKRIYNETPQTNDVSTVLWLVQVLGFIDDIKKRQSSLNW